MPADHIRYRPFDRTVLLPKIPRDGRLALPRHDYHIRARKLLNLFMEMNCVQEAGSVISQI
jgi:hypothetical protein